MLDAEAGKIDTNYKIETVFDKDFVRELHAFQSKTNAGITGRSDVDCIVGRKTIQQLATYT